MFHTQHAWISTDIYININVYSQQCYVGSFLCFAWCLQKGYFSQIVHKFVYIPVSENFSFAKIIYPPDRCGISRSWLKQHEHYITQVHLVLGTIKGHSKMCSFVTQHNATDVSSFEVAFNWHADCRIAHHSCCQKCCWCQRCEQSAPWWRCGYGMDRHKLWTTNSIAFYRWQLECTEIPWWDPEAHCLAVHLPSSLGSICTQFL